MDRSCGTSSSMEMNGMGKKDNIYKKKDLANIYCRGNFGACTDKNILFMALKESLNLD